MTANDTASHIEKMAKQMFEIVYEHIEANPQELGLDAPLDLRKYPERMGFPWTAEEESQLLAAVAAKKTIEEIAVENKRGAAGTCSHLCTIAKRLYTKNGKGVEEIAAITGLESRLVKQVLGIPVGKDE